MGLVGLMNFILIYSHPLSSQVKQPHLNGFAREREKGGGEREREENIFMLVSFQMLKNQSFSNLER